jgi:hypothetical protein
MSTKANKRRRLQAVTCATALALAIGCSSTQVGAPDSRLDLAWPAGDPRVRLEALIPLDEMQTRAGARWLQRLSGSRQGFSISRPFAVAWDDNDLLVTDAGAGRVLRIRADGRAEASPERAFESPVGIASCEGQIFLVDSRSGDLVRLDADLRRAEILLDDLERPTGVACGSERIWVLETGRHRVLTLDHAGHVEAIGERGDETGSFNYPTAIALDRGAVWVGDTLNFRIQKLSVSSGSFLESFGELGGSPGELPRLKGIAVDSSGNLWVSDAHLDQVALYSPKGDYLLSIGGLGTEPGRFSFPAGIAAHADGRVAVVDSLNRRLQVFRLVALSAAYSSQNGGESR